jgi:plastocyanin
MRNVQRMLLGAIVLSLGAGLAVQSRTLAASAHAKTVIIKTISSKGTYLYQPKTKSVKVGTKVVWQNPSDAPHTVGLMRE